jgi:NtrC-family two-component system sensor histidine kinase KinB
LASPRGIRLRALPPVAYRISLFLAAVLLLVALVVHTDYVIDRLKGETQGLCHVLAQFLAVSTFEAVEDPGFHAVFQDVIRNINFPIVLTDPDGLPRAWTNIGIPAYAVPDSVLDRAAATHVVPPEVRRIQEIVRNLDRRAAPIPVVRLHAPGVLGYVHYGEPPLVRQLRWVPYLEYLVIAVLLALSFVGFRRLMAAEQRSLWAAIAKETAHQLGTPLSSLLGWTALLRERAGEGGDGAGVLEVAGEMERDLDRLAKVASRFGQVGSVPVLAEGDVTEVTSDAVAYFRHRLPHLGRQIEIAERYDPIPRVRFHRELFEWVVENLIRNAIDAADKWNGRIEVALTWDRARQEVLLTVKDNGRGMTPEERRHAFRPGFTTKRRGWGLGLALARRVIREYHDGRIFVAESVPGQGTTMVVALRAPTARA